MLSVISVVYAIDERKAERVGVLKQEPQVMLRKRGLCSPVVYRDTIVFSQLHSTKVVEMPLSKLLDVLLEN